MGSLFDLAAELSQYDDARNPALLVPFIDANTLRGSALRKQPHDVPSANVAINNQVSETSTDMSLSALSLLDETLVTIYAVRKPQPQTTSRPTPPPLAFTSQRSDSQLLHGHPVPTSNGEYARQRLRLSHATTATPLQNVFSQSVSFRAGASSATAMSTRSIPPPPTATPPPLVSEGKPRTDQPTDPDITAKQTLREIKDELEQLPAEAAASPRRRQRLQRSLSDKYLTERLNKLPSTPFVQLARKKTQQKIDLLTAEKATAHPPPVVAPPIETLHFPPDQHDKLVKLATIPDTHVAKLSTTQQHMVQFAKRYDKILRLSSAELATLPVSQAQLLHQLQRQLPQAPH